ncbi:putative prophage phiRv2 integrase [Rhodococcus sp. RD6.2]|uniref:tyrosine-type recombinase/integrase n=1 Tax=Rhodococcus sp. RD6.2 TaxID=260936 RepID=UPI00063BBC50|nr:site-specific integrase [Rhodococcus sp. RD6.2]CRK49220.1 putative prophage phiRv2 integrase [Rhodococcus sp. RD6.2]
MATKRRSWGTCKQLKSKNYRATYIGPDGRQYAAPRTFAAKVDAEGWLATEKRKIDLDTWRPPGTRHERSLTLRAYASSWLEQRTLKARTRGLYADLLRLHILPVLGDLAVSAITPAIVRAWYARLETGPTRTSHSYSLLHAICATAVSDEVLDANPCRIRSAMQTSRAKEIELVTPAELVALADEMPENLRVAVLLTAWCGLRSGELKELRRKDVGPRGETIRVERSVTYRSGVYLVDTPKTRAGKRRIAIPPHIVPVLNRHLGAVGKEGEALLFPGKSGGHLSDWELRNPFKRAAGAIGKPELTPHSLRHVGAVLAAQSGASTAELMLRLGHTTPNMAMKYQHVAAGRDAEIAKRLSALAGE